MCGIAGFLDRGAHPREELLFRARGMARAIASRGPDAEGAWADERVGVGLGHRRLSILELSPLGAQPMQSRNGRFVLTFNGEIYNFEALRARLERDGHRFRGRSDTEVMLAAFEQWGVEESLGRFEGMLAFGLWDAGKRELWLGRDRLGEKPLYYGWSGGAFLFGSELKALRAYPGWKGGIDRAAVSLYLRYGCVPAPYCIHEGIRKLPAGAFLRVPAGLAVGEYPAPVAYWRLSDVALQARREPFAGSLDEAVLELERLLERAVGQRMVSDVPLGAFLSGGVDSSLIVSFMQKARGSGTGPVRTFTIGFTEQDFDEAAHARRIAAFLGTRHEETRLSPREAMEVIPGLPRDYDEPFADSSQIATLLVARHARKHVVVCLSGDAGDELFAGYHRHFRGSRLWKIMGPVPAPVREGLARALGLVPASVWAGVGRGLGARGAVFALKAQKLIGGLPARSSRELYLSLVSSVREPERLALGSREPPTLPTAAGESLPELPVLGGALADFQYLDAMTYLPDDILTKVDRATMASSLEARVPFLAEEVIRFAWSLPECYKVSHGQGKWILRKLLARHLPPELILKPKSGFAVPLAAWLRGPLRPWAQALLAPGTLRAQGYFDAREVGRLLDDHLSGARDLEGPLWSLLMFQSWLAETKTP